MMQQPQPPQPPQIRRKLLIYPTQIIGITIMLIGLAAAFLGVFGKSEGSVEAAADQLTLRVDYPERYRYGNMGSLQIAITSHHDFAALTVNIERRYIKQFSDVSFTPDVDNINEQFYVIELELIETFEKGRKGAS
jgi:hypothetical protein